MNAVQAEIDLLNEAGSFLDQKLVDEFIAQGHHLTGAFENSLHGTVLNTGRQTRLVGQMANYGIYVNYGVKSANIPYGGGGARSGAGTSKYITGLINYWKLRGLGDKEATRAAFATAHVHKKEGMPSVGSYRFTSTGQRRTFINIVEEKHGEEVNKLLGNGIDNIIDTLFHETKSETI